MLLHESLQLLACALAHLWHFTCHQGFVPEQLTAGLHLQEFGWELSQAAHMQEPILSTAERMQEECHQLWVCGRSGRELSALPAAGLHTQAGGSIPSLSRGSPACPCL